MTNHYYHLLATLILALIPASLMAQPAQALSDSTPPADTVATSLPQTEVLHNPNDHKTVAVISSFAQDSPWSDDYIPLVTAAASSNANTYCDIYYLQSLQITDSTSYEKVKHSLFKYYSQRKPDYVVMIGKMAFSMRDEMRKEWGNVPMFLIANSADLAPLDYYFSGADRGSEAEVVQKGKLHELQSDYNFTALIVPYLYRQTVDLMVRAMRHEINELVFVAVPTYVDRNNSKRISEFLAQNYPGIRYRWLYADTENIEELRSLLIERQEGTGILLSNWAILGEGPFGDKMIINQEAKLLSSSVNPVFVASASLINNGAAGGVFLNRADIKDRVNSIVDAMLSGKDMSRIPIYKCEEEAKVINYERAIQYDFNMKALSNDDVEFVGRPLSFWDEYHWQTIIGLLVLFLFGVMVWKRNKSQNNEIELLKMHRKFVDGMPIAYTRAILYFSPDRKQLIDVKYNEPNEAMRDIMNHLGSDDKMMLFPLNFFNEKAQQLFNKEQKIEFRHKFEFKEKKATSAKDASGKDTAVKEAAGKDKITKVVHYDFVLDLADSEGAHKNNPTVRELDVFAVDVTNQMNAEKKLKDLSRKLDLTINAAGIIPWEWDIKTDVLRFDAYSLFGRQLHDIDDMKEAPCTYLDVSKEFMPLIHPDDKPKLEENNMQLLTKKISSFTLRYRLHIVREGVDRYQWVKIKGRLTEFDSKGYPTKAAGGMWTLEDSEIVPDPME